MSDTTTNLRRKIDSAKDLQSVVRTMRALAASSIGQYQKSVLALADYSRTVDLGLSVCLRQLRSDNSAVKENDPAPIRARTAIVFGSDQGLVGQFNDIVAENANHALKALQSKSQVWAVGERVHARLTDLGLMPTALFPVPSSVSAITSLVSQLLLKIENPGEGAGLILFYNRASTGALYAPTQQRLLPLDETWQQQLVKTPWPSGALPEIIGATTLQPLVREYLFISLFRGCAESLASENASRLAAMQRADKNIGDLLEDLTGTFNRLRQDRIDEELFDVVAGFEISGAQEK